TGIVTVSVSDGLGGKVNGSVAVATSADQAPVLSAVSASPASVAPGGNIALSASAVDPDGDPLTYTWTAPGGWTLSGSGASVSVKAPATYSTTAVISVTVSDGKGGSVAAKIAVATLRDSAPVLASLSATPVPVAPLGNVTVTASAS